MLYQDSVHLWDVEMSALETCWIDISTNQYFYAIFTLVNSAV